MGRAHQDPIADALVLTFTEGVSLGEWERTGLIAREWALYERLRGFYRKIVLVTWGGAADRPIAARLGAELVCNERGLSAGEFAAHAAGAVAGLLGRAESALVKTNQMMAGDVPAKVVQQLRANGRVVALVARGGYHWSCLLYTSPSPRDRG